MFVKRIQDGAGYLGTLKKNAPDFSGFLVEDFNISDILNKITNYE